MPNWWDNVKALAEVVDDGPVHTSVHLSPDAPGTGGVVHRGPLFEAFASPSLKGGGTATRVPVTVEVRGAGAEPTSHGYIAVCTQQHTAGEPGVVRDGTWYGAAREHHPDAANDAANHQEHPGAAVIHALLANGVSVGPVAS